MAERARTLAERDGAVTIDDVAAAAGVSTATVSRVMNNRPIVAEETRQRVLDAVARLNFRPSSLGRNLATRRTGTLGLVIADITNPFYPEIVRAVEQTAAAHGLSVLLYDTAEDSKREAQALRLLSQQHVDGIIICASRLPEERIEALARGATPLVLINRAPAARSIGSVDVDQEAGVREAVRHLAALGHRRIAYIGGPAASQVQQRRLTAFHAICTELGIAARDRSILMATPTVAGGTEAARQLLTGSRRKARPTAILAYNDLVAIGAITAAQDASIAVPDALSVVGHDDIPLAALLRPALTTVRQPMHALGEQAVQMLATHLHARPAPVHEPIVTRLAPTLIVRDSTAPIMP